MHKELKDIFDYLVSIRVLKTYLSVDVEFPITWKIPKKYVQEDKVMENNKMNENKRFFSFVSEFNDENLNNTINGIKNIISHNKEIEMKEKLLKEKIDELKKIFEIEQLQNLQNLKFELLNEKLEDGEEDFKQGRISVGMAEE